ncbi:MULTISPECIES: acyltransferase family protein [Calothrix]|uniref:Acyltransferase n=2 Tax=Calothrix TaxID=1186 RepID=A0ABR8A2T9_9CYAN|nr:MULTISPECIES: acyltransferase [Calothrix]MBD2193879.1 acyltransferase [Calothrix parietina FACHB-288]MBD2222885.1 acyltransferase [Calothrix anomala FACHB-343]
MMSLNRVNYVNKKKLNSLQILRGIAALLVILIHGTGVVETAFNENYLDQYFYMGNCGVDIFFVLSGFIIFYSNYNLIGDPSKFVSFIRKRIIRIYPIYWIVTLSILPAYAIIPSFGQGDELNFNVILTSLFLIPNYRSPILVSGWTLIHEMLFYLIFGLIIVLKPKLSKSIIIIWSTIILVLFIYNFYAIEINIQNPVIRLVTHPQNIEFLLGCLAAKIVINTLNNVKKISTRTIVLIKLNVLFCALIIIMSGFARYYNIKIFNLLTGVHVLIYGITSMILILCLAFLDVLNKNVYSKDINYDKVRKNTGVSLINRYVLFSGLILLGEASYSIYLTHGPAISALSKAMKHFKIHELIGGFWASNILFMLVVASGVITYLYVELPMLNFLKKRFTN